MQTTPPSDPTTRLASQSPWRARGALALLFFTLVFWLNQSISGDAWGSLRDRVWTTHTATPLETARYPFIFLYRHSFDEELYWNVSGEILGKPYDRAFLANARARTGTFATKAPALDAGPHRPYAEVPLEYPALSLPFLLLPRLLTSDLESYSFVFSASMGLCAFLAFVLIVKLFTRAYTAGRTRAYLLATALSLAHGALFVQRLDAVLALALAGVLYFWMRDRFALFAFVLGLASAFKLTPVLLVLPLLATDRHILQHARACALSFSGALVAGLLPMFIFSKSAFSDLMRYHSERGLHCESTWATLYGLLGGRSSPAIVAFGSLNLEGPIPDLLAKVALPVTIALLTLLSHSLWKRRLDSSILMAEDAVRALLTACIVLWLGSKVFSPQYLGWGIPLAIPCLMSKRDRRAGGLFVVALLLTQIYHRGFYDAVSQMRPLGLLTIGLRDAALVGAAFILHRNFRTALRATSSAEG